MAERNSENLPNDIIEIVFVNDYPEEALDKSFSCNTNVKAVYVENPYNMGIQRTKINGIENASAEFILFLDQDDIIADNYISSQLSIIGDHDAVFCNGIYKKTERIFVSEPRIADFENYVEYGYPLTSLGQLLVRKDCISEIWKNNPLNNNGWDDGFFWACLVYEKKSIVYNNSILYTHVENGNNLSFDWKKMKLSGEEYMETFLSSAIMSNSEKEIFISFIKRKLNKYDRYIEVDSLFEKISVKELIRYLEDKNYRKIAVYGLGVYGSKLCNMISESDIQILYGIDRNASEKKYLFPVYDKPPLGIDADITICATVFDDDNIIKNLSGNCSSVLKILTEIANSKGE